ncbi:aminopeptidase P family protein [Tistrella sp.]|uniref:aminopeptidase P family protein n=1 Tax=Tistrella sp. TaxID=2024861 RepID=UPI000C98283D|nr:aminopeptidase P family protein [Tistrella sp.]MAD40721.1 X-Pro aminopeptidase [Tistrella sp.]
MTASTPDGTAAPISASQDGDALARRLAARGARVEAAGLDALLAGIDAAASPAGDLRWVDLVLGRGPHDPDLVAALVARRAEVAARLEDGLWDEAPDTAGRVARLRLRLEAAGVDGFIVPRADEHQGEYVPRAAERLAWITGFHGSAGTAVILKDRAAIFVDGRYTIQAEQEVDGQVFERCHVVERTPIAWIAETAGRGARIGYDPRLHTPAEISRWQRVLARAGVELAALEGNPLDAIWNGRAAMPLAPVVPHDEAFAGESVAAKRRRIGEAIAAAGADAYLITMPEELTWLLNIRGADVPCTPLPLGFGLIASDGEAQIFIDRRKLTPEVIDHLAGEARVAGVEALGAALDDCAGRRVLIDPTTANVWADHRLKQAGATVVEGNSPVSLPKARKNAVELAGTRAAHLRDAGALVTFLAWIAAEAPKGHLTELDAAAELGRLRAGLDHYRGMSFETISASGPHAAMAHYRVNERSNRRLEPGQIYLVDSGGQYLDGTTDVTRTVAVGDLPAEVAEAFTRVLKGHIAVAVARFPAGTTGAQLDVLARRDLWAAGLDFDHGTGHGVGSYLSVHEGPQRISKLSTQPLEPGMILSDEPGYYEPGRYGIRIENLLVVRDEGTGFAGRRFLGFETLTLAPIDRSLIRVDMLTADEIAWVDAYHARVLAEVSPLVDDGVRGWLARVTRPLAAG